MKKNDILTPIGLVLAIGFIFFAIAQGKGGVGMFIDIPSFLITVGGSFAAVLITFDLDTVKRIPSALKMSIVSPSVNKVDLVDQFKELSKTIRKDGILAIEQQVAEIEEPFLKKSPYPYTHLTYCSPSAHKERHHQYTESSRILQTHLQYLEESREEKSSINVILSFPIHRLPDLPPSEPSSSILPVEVAVFYV